MAKLSVGESVKEILADVLLCDENLLTPGALLVEDLGMDSLDRTEIVMRLEEELFADGMIDEEKAEGWKTVGDVMELAAAATGEGAAGK